MLKYDGCKWLSFSDDHSQMFVDEYPSKHTIEPTFEQTLIKQAKIIHADHPKLIHFLSGGIDSQTSAYAFLKAKIPIKHVFLKIYFNDVYNRAEYLFAQQFAHTHNLDLEICEYRYDSASLTDLALREDHFNTGKGVGALLQIEGFQKYVNDYPDHMIMASYGNFLYKREGSTCYGLVPNIHTGLFTGFLHERTLSFYYYTPLIFQYYEHLHRSDLMLQYPTRYQPKNFAYTHLGFPLRPKLNSWEQLHPDKSYSNLTLIDFGNDKTPRIDPSMYSQKLLLKAMNIESKDILQRKPSNDNYTELYRFETTVNQWD